MTREAFTGPPPEWVLAHIDTGIVVQDPELRILYANEAASRLLGRPEDEITGMTSMDEAWGVVNVEGQPIDWSEQPVGQAVSTGLPVRGGIIGVRRPGAGERIWLVVDALPIRGESGEVEHYLSTFTQVSPMLAERHDLATVARELEHVVDKRTTELSEANIALREATSRYEAVIRAMAEGVTVLGEGGQILTANPAALSILGLSLEQMQGLRVADPHWAMTREDGTPLPYDEAPYEVTRRTGEPCLNRIIGVQRGVDERAWISINTDPIRIDGEMVGVVATFTDVTRERETLRRLAEANRQMEWINEMMPGVVIESFEGDDGVTRITYASRSVEQLYGISAEEMIADATAAWGRLHPEDAARLMEQRDALGTDEVRGELEREIRIADGEGGWRWVRSTTAAPLRVEHGWLMHTIQRDITHEREISRKFREAQRRESMGTLASGIAHNFNNMLAAILPSLERAREEIGGELGEELDSAFQAASAASELVRRLARLARREGAGERRRISVREVAEEVVQISRRTFDRRIEIDLDLADGPVEVVAPRAELQQVFLNLLLNARDALADAGTPRIGMTVRESDDRERVLIEVADNGEGMAPETVARLGEPFFTTKEVGQGTGLGMATVIGTVEELGGEITWESSPGEGATFRIALPAASGTADGAVPTEERSPDRLLEGESVLCVDDEPLVRASLARMLQRMGATVHVADSGRAALEHLAEHGDIRVLLVDHSMPGMGGDEVARRAREQHPGLRIVLMSGYLPDEVPDTVDTVLSKPFTSHALGASLEGVLR